MQVINNLIREEHEGIWKPIEETPEQIEQVRRRYEGGNK